MSTNGTETEILTTVQVDDTPAPTKQDVNLNDLKVGYVVGLTDDGNFLFEVFGKQKGLAELLGLHHYASFKVNQLLDKIQTSGDSLVHEVGKGLAVVNQKVDKLLQVLVPKKPGNQL